MKVNVHQKSVTDWTVIHDHDGVLLFLCFGAVIVVGLSHCQDEAVKTDVTEVGDGI